MLAAAAYNFKRAMKALFALLKTLIETLEYDLKKVNSQPILNYGRQQ
jgi:hypothetical protein